MNTSSASVFPVKQRGSFFECEHAHTRHVAASHNAVRNERHFNIPYGMILRINNPYELKRSSIFGVRCDVERFVCCHEQAALRAATHTTPGSVVCFPFLFFLGHTWSF